MPYKCLVKYFFILYYANLTLYIFNDFVIHCPNHLGLKIESHERAHSESTPIVGKS